MGGGELRTEVKDLAMCRPSSCKWVKSPDLSRKTRSQTGLAKNRREGKKKGSIEEMTRALRGWWKGRSQQGSKREACISRRGVPHHKWRNNYFFFSQYVNLLGETEKKKEKAWDRMGDAEQTSV